MRFCDNGFKEYSTAIQNVLILRLRPSVAGNHVALSRCNSMVVCKDATEYKYGQIVHNVKNNLI